MYFTVIEVYKKCGRTLQISNDDEFLSLHILYTRSFRIILAYTKNFVSLLQTVLHSTKK